MAFCSERQTMTQLLVASSNRGKLQEIAKILAPLNIIGQEDYNIRPAEENACTFVENALLKARHASQASGLPALADDSGLVVDALQGAPGIYSARYAGEQASDQDNIDKLLNAMQHLDIPQRSAQFFCAMVLVRFPEDPMPMIACGHIRGHIQTHSSGSQGFGYDPVFYVDAYQKTMAELGPGIKNRISHRAQALQSLKEGLKDVTLSD